MKNFYTSCALILALLFANTSNAQVFKLHAEYKSDWYGNGYTMVEDIPGYPSVMLKADLSEDQFVIESDFGQNRWRKYGTTGYDTAFPMVWYTLIVTDNYLSQNTQQDFYYTTRLKNVGYSSTNVIVMQTEFEPIRFAAVNPVTQSPAVNSVNDFQPVDVNVELADVPSNEEKFFVRYSTDNFQSSQVVKLSFPGGAGSKNCIATIPGFAAGTSVNYYIFSSTVNADLGTLNNDYDLVTLRLSNNQGVNYSYTVAAALSKITFKVNMSNVTVSPNGVYLVGNFNNFDTTAAPMTNLGNGIYEYILFADTAATLQYKYLNGNSFANEEQVPAACGIANGFGGYNRIYDVPGVDTEIDTVCFSKCTACSNPTPVKIKFRLNMVNQTVSPNGVHIAASFNNFDPTIDSLTHVGNGIYETFIFLDSTSTVTYKFINGNSFTDQELVPQTCGQPDGFSGYNRVLQVPEANADLPIVCFSQCSNCNPIGFTKVKFIVNMAQQTVSPNGVHIAGSFNNFNTSSDTLVNIGNNVYEITLNLDSTQRVFYKFINGNSFNEEEIIPSTCGISNGFGGYNRYLDVPEQLLVLDTVCFASCAPCANTYLVNVHFRVNMSNETLSPNGIHIAGTFNGFDADSTQMLPIGGNIYEAVISLDTTSTVLYKFINGDDFIGVENVPSGCGQPDGFGGFNRSLAVPNADSVLANICFSACSDCNNATFVDVTFLVDMSSYIISPNGVHLAGTFNGFSASATTMNAIGANVYAATVSLDTATVVEYKFINGNSFGAGIDEVVPALCGVPNGFGGFNRSLAVPNANDTVDLVCFEACIANCGFGVQEEKNQAEEFQVYANNNGNLLNVNYYSATNENLQLLVYSSDGKLVARAQLPSGKGSSATAISVSELPDALYYVQLQGTSATWSKKIMLIR